jgi:hypothetical protein
MTDDDPVPLKAGGEASPELVRALKALGKDNPADAARLQRVALKLGAALADAPPPDAANGLGKLFGAKTLITGIVIGLAALGWLGYHRVGRRDAPVKPETPARVETSSAAPAQAPEMIAPPANRDAEKLANVAPAAEPSERAQAPASPRARRAARRAAPSAMHGAATRSDVSPSPSGSAEPAAASPVSAAPAEARAAEPVEEQPKPQPKATKLAEEPERPEAPKPRSEVELLFEARKAARSQPSAALQLLDEHAARFPSGQLAPEREVLRIEALRRLGRTAEANERLRQFEARYPDSIHLRRLQRQGSPP